MITKLSAVNCDNLTAVVACPSVGNVGQLSADLLISNLNAEYIGMAWHPGVLPLAGGDPYHKSSTKICTSNDFYLSKDRNLLFVQLRAPVLKKSVPDFTSELVALFTQIGVQKVIILSGMFAHARGDVEIQAGPFRYVLNKFSESDSSALSEPWVRMTGNDPQTGSLCPKMSGSGFTRVLMDQCTEKSIAAVALLYFCSEGDNVQDSVQFTLKINDWLRALPSQSKMDMPISWKYLFGSERPRNLY